MAHAGETKISQARNGAGTPAPFPCLTRLSNAVARFLETDSVKVVQLVGPPKSESQLDSIR